MLALGPALSAAYKSLGGGESRYQQKDMMGQFGLTSPLGTRKIGYGLSQFINATLPWFSDPGFPDRVYGVNMHVATENMSAILDSPTASYINSLQESLKPMESKVVTANVPAIVCESNLHLDQSVEYFQSLWRAPSPNTSSPSSAETWSQINTYHIGVLMPMESDNTNFIIANWNDRLDETFGSHLLQYSLSRQNYTGSWRVDKTSVKLVNAIPSYQRIDDHCLLRSNWLALADLYSKVFAEFDWRYHQKDRDFYQQHIKNDATLLASMVWSRIAALAPETVISLGPNPGCDPEGLPELTYETNVVIETVAVTIKPGWGIIFVLALYPILLVTSLVFRVISWPRSPIGEGFSLISLLASVEKRSLALLEGAGLSGKLDRPVFVGFFVNGKSDNTDSTEVGKIISLLKTREMRSEELSKGVKYS